MLKEYLAWVVVRPPVRGAVRILPLLALLQQHIPPLELLEPLTLILQAFSSSEPIARSISAASSFTILLAFTVLMARASRASAQDALMVKPRGSDFVRTLSSEESVPKTSRSRAGLPTSAGRPLLSLLLLLTLLVRVSSLLLLLLPLMSPKLALPEEIDDVGKFPSASPPAPARGSAAGASRVASGKEGHTSAMSRSGSLSKSPFLLPP